MKRHRQKNTPKHYTYRKANGQIAKVVSIKKSMAADRAVKSKTKAKRNQGHRGDW